MPSTSPLGEFEHLVLLAILRQNGQAYGVSIRKEIKNRTGRETAPGALYTTLDRLESKGMLLSEIGDPTPERGGRAKRFYVVTSAGHGAVVEAQRALASLSQGLNLLGATHA